MAGDGRTGGKAVVPGGVGSTSVVDGGTAAEGSVAMALVLPFHGGGGGGGRSGGGGDAGRGAGGGAGWARAVLGNEAAAATATKVANPKDVERRQRAMMGLPLWPKKAEPGSITLRSSWNARAWVSTGGARRQSAHAVPGSSQILASLKMRTRSVSRCPSFTL